MGNGSSFFSASPSSSMKKKPRCVSISEGGAKRIWPGFCIVYVGKWSGRPPAGRPPRPAHRSDEVLARRPFFIVQLFTRRRRKLKKADTEILF